MAVGEWIRANAEYISSIGVIITLLFNAASIRSEAKTRRVANQISLTENQRELWSDFYKQPELHRVLEQDIDLAKNPLRKDEEIFVILVIQHLNAAFQTIESDLAKSPEKLNEDVASFLSRPIPNAVWTNLQSFLDRRFVKFVERARSGKRDSLVRHAFKLVLRSASLW